MARIRPRSIGALHGGAGWLYGVHLAGTDERRVRSALVHLCGHLDAEGRLLGSAEPLHRQIGDREFRDRQRAVLGTARQTLGDIHRAARSAVHHDRVDLLAETVDWYGRTVQSAQAGLQGWKAANERHHWEGVLSIAQDCGRPDLGRSLLAFEAWCWRARGETVPDTIAEALATEPPPDQGAGPYRVLAAALVQRSGVPVPAWAVGVEPWSELTPATHPEPRQGWPAAAWVWVEGGEGSASAIAESLSGTEPTDWGRQVATVVSHCSAAGVAGARAARVGQLLRALAALEWWDIPLREAVTAVDSDLCDALRATDFDVVGWWRRMLGRIRSDQRSALSSATQHILRIAVNGPMATAAAELVIELARDLPEPVFRSRVIREVPGVLGHSLVHDERDRAWAHRVLSALVSLEASAVPEVTSDNLMFGIGRALGGRRDRDAVHRAFARIRNPWIRGQVLRVQRPDCIAALDIAALPAQLKNPLAQRFALTHIFGAIGATCSTATLVAGIEIAAQCEPYPEVRVAGLEGVLSALGARADHAPAMAALWRHHGERLDVGDGYAWRVLDLLLAQGVRPEHCPEGLTGWMRDRMDRLRPAERTALAAHPAGSHWPTGDEPPPGPVSEAGTGRLRRALTADRPPLDEVDAWTSQWSPDEWVLWTNTLTIAEPSGLNSISVEAATYLAHKIGPADPSPSSMTALLCLLSGGAAVDDAVWSPVHRRLVALARSPSVFDPDCAAEYGPPDCWAAVLAWMAMGDRSEWVVQHIRHPAVRAWLDGQQQWVTRSEYGRLYPIVRHPNRSLLSWLTLMGMDRVRPAQMLVAELLTRCARPDELDRLRETWLRDDEGEA